MPFMPNGYYNDGSMGQAFGNIASLFAPPTPQQALMAQTIKQQNDALAQKQAILAGKPKSFADMYVLENADPTNMAKAQQFEMAASGQPIAAQDPYKYVYDNAGSTFSGKAMDPLSQGQTRILPFGVAGPLGLTSTPAAAADASDGEGGAKTPAAPTAPAAPNAPVVQSNPAADSTKQMTVDQLRAKTYQGVLDNPSDPNAVAAADKINQLAPQAGGMRIQVGNGENAAAAASGKAAGEREAALQSAALDAPGKIARISLLSNVLQRTQTGPLAGAAGTVVSVANQLGIAPDTIKAMGLDPNQAVDNQIAQKLAAELVAGSIGAKNGGFPASNFSVAERQFIESMFPGILNQPGSNQAVADVLTAVQKRPLDQAAEWHAYRVAHAPRTAMDPSPSYQDFEDQYIQAHAKDNIFQPIIDKYKAGGYAPPGAASPAQPGAAGPITPFNANGAGGSFNSTIPGSAAPFPGAAAASPATPRSQAEYDSLPAGTVYLAPDGQPRTKQ